MEQSKLNNSQMRIASYIEHESKFNLILSSAKQVINFENSNKKYVFYLKIGEVEVRRLIDDKIISNIKSPAIIGLSTLFHEENYHYIRSSSNIEILAIESREMVKVIGDNNLWEDAFIIMSSALISLYFRDEVVSSNKVYGVVRNHIEILWSLSENERSQISIFDFILSRTSISRSSLNKILKNLSIGGYIKLNRGRLLDKKQLPINY